MRFNNVKKITHSLSYHRYTKQTFYNMKYVILYETQYLSYSQEHFTRNFDQLVAAECGANGVRAYHTRRLLLVLRVSVVRTTRSVVQLILELNSRSSLSTLRPIDVRKDGAWVLGYTCILYNTYDNLQLLVSKRDSSAVLKGLTHAVQARAEIDAVAPIAFTAGRSLGSGLYL